MSLASNPRLRSVPSSAITKNLPLSTSVGRASARYFPASSPDTSLFSPEDISTATADSYQLGSKKDGVQGGPEVCATKVFVRVRPFTQRELGEPTVAGGSSSCRSEFPVEVRSVVRVDNHCPSHITTLDPEKNFTPKDTYVFENCFDSAMTCTRALEEIDGDTISPQEIECSMQDQAFVYASVGQPVLQNVLEGYNGCVFAYGQTGSGKTYTMMGLASWVEAVEVARTPRGPCFPPQKGTSAVGALHRFKKTSGPLSRGGRSDFSTLGVAASAEVPVTEFPICMHAKGSTVCPVEGIIPRLLRQLFLDLHKKHQMDNTHSFRVEIEYYEIYNEKVINLLSTEMPNVELRVRNSPSGPYVDGLQRTHVEDVESVFKCLRHGNTARHSAVTRFNNHSSRSHAILTLHLIQMHISGDDARSRLCSKINLVDLAGSERTGASGVIGKHFIESTRINLSLTVLGRVIDALADLSQGKQGTFCPYRDSNLTWLLRDSLGGNSKTTMIATVSPHSSSFEETFQTLRYASRAKQIVTKAVVNEDPQQRLIKQLNMEVRRLQRLLEGEEDKGNDDYVDELRDRVVSLEAELSEKKAQLDRAEAEITLLRTSMEASKAAVSLSSSGALNTVDASTTKSLIATLRSSIEKLKEENLRLLLTETELQVCKDDRAQLTKRLAQICKSTERESKSLQSNIRRLERENHKLESEKAKLLNLNVSLQASEEHEAELIARIQQLEQDNKFLQSKVQSTASVPPKSLDLSDDAKRKLQLMGLLPHRSDSLFSASHICDDSLPLIKVESLVESLTELAFKEGEGCKSIQNRSAPSPKRKNGTNPKARACQNEKRGTSNSKLISGECLRSLGNASDGVRCTTQPFCTQMALPTKKKGIRKVQADPKQLSVLNSSMKMNVPKDVKKDFRYRMGGKDEKHCVSQPEAEGLKGHLKSVSKQHSEKEMESINRHDNAMDLQKTDIQKQTRLLEDAMHSLISLTDNMNSLTAKEQDELTEGGGVILGIMYLLKDRLKLLQARQQNIQKEVSLTRDASKDSYEQDLERSATQHQELDPFGTAACNFAPKGKNVHSNITSREVPSVRLMSQEEVRDNPHMDGVKLSRKIGKATTIHTPCGKEDLQHEMKALQLKYVKLCDAFCRLYQDHDESLMVALTDASDILLQALTKLQLETTGELVHIKWGMVKLRLEHERANELNGKEVQKLKEVHAMALSDATERVRVTLLQCAQLQEQVNHVESDRSLLIELHSQSVKDLQDKLESTKEQQQSLEFALACATGETRVLREYTQWAELIHQQQGQEVVARMELITEELSEALELATTFIRLASGLELEALQRQLDNACCEYEAREKSFQERFSLLQKQFDEVVTQKKNLLSQQEEIMVQLNSLLTEKSILSAEAVKMHQEYEQLSIGHRAAIELLEKEKNQLQVTKQAEVDSLKAELERLHKDYTQIVEEMEQTRSTLQSFEKALREREDGFQRAQKQLVEVALAREEEKTLLARLKDAEVERQESAFKLSETKAAMAAYKSESTRIQKGMQEYINELSKKLEEAQNYVEVLKSEIKKESKRHDQVAAELQEAISRLNEELQNAANNLHEREVIICNDARELSQLRKLVEDLEKDKQEEEQEKKILASEIIHLQHMLSEEARSHLEVIAAKEAEVENYQSELKSFKEEKEATERVLKQEVETMQLSLNATMVTLKTKEKEFQDRIVSLQEDELLRKENIAALEVKQEELHDKLRLQIQRSIQLVSDRDTEIVALQEEKRNAFDSIAALEEKLTATINDNKKLLDQYIKQQGECERQSKQLDKLTLDLRELNGELYEARRKLSEKEADLVQVKKYLEGEVNKKAAKLGEVEAVLRSQKPIFEKEVDQLKDIIQKKDLDLSLMTHERAHAVTYAREVQQKYEKIEDELKVSASQLQCTDWAFTQLQFFIDQMETFFDIKMNCLMDVLGKQILDTIEVNKCLKVELYRVSQECSDTSNHLVSLQNDIVEEKSAHAAKLETLLNELNQLSCTCSQREMQLNELTQRIDILQTSHELEKDGWREGVAEQSEIIFRLKRELDQSEKLRESLEGRLEQQQDILKDEIKNYDMMLERQRNEIAELKEYLEFQASLDLCEVESSRNTSFWRQPAGYNSTPANSSTTHSIGSGGTTTTMRNRVGDVLMSLFQRRGCPAPKSSAPNSDAIQGVGGSSGTEIAIHLNKESKNQFEGESSSFIGDHSPRVPSSMSISLHDFIASNNANTPKQ
ncbi:unnamed protein product [Phytomonas sp. EM1]|nr:unnamed protein product [Phytomonas sp. EM1]|eukprot:CCW60785.1 unnamed protein product [Phytomonas sp. isolate EM1]